MRKSEYCANHISSFGCPYYRGGGNVTWSSQYDQYQTHYEIQYRLASTSAWSTLGKVASNGKQANLQEIYSRLLQGFKEIYYRVVIYFDKNLSGDRTTGHEVSDTYRLVFLPSYTSKLQENTGDKINTYPLYDTPYGEYEVIHVKVDENVVKTIPLVNSEENIGGEREIVGTTGRKRLASDSLRNTTVSVSGNAYAERTHTYEVYGYRSQTHYSYYQYNNYSKYYYVSAYGYYRPYVNSGGYYHYVSGYYNMTGTYFGVLYAYATYYGYALISTAVSGQYYRYDVNIYYPSYGYANGYTYWYYQSRYGYYYYYYIGIKEAKTSGAYYYYYQYGYPYPTSGYYYYISGYYTRGAIGEITSGAYYYYYQYGYPYPTSGYRYFVSGYYWYYAERYSGTYSYMCTTGGSGVIYNYTYAPYGYYNIDGSPGYGYSRYGGGFSYTMPLYGYLYYYAGPGSLYSYRYYYYNAPASYYLRYNKTWSYGYYITGYGYNSYIHHYTYYPYLSSYNYRYYAYAYK